METKITNLRFMSVHFTIRFVRCAEYFVFVLKMFCRCFADGCYNIIMDIVLGFTFLLATEFLFLPCNRPEGTEWLKTSLSSHPSAVDFDGDGREDLVYAVGDWSDYGDMWAGNFTIDGFNSI